MALSWYQCKHCGNAIKKDSSPSTSGCSESSYHSWTRLAEVGDVNYGCRHCGTTIQAKSSPSTTGCPSGSYHSWNRL